MDETQALKLAELLKGQPWQSGGGIWVVVKELADGSAVVISQEAITEYASIDAIEAGDRPDNFIRLE